VFNRFFEVPVIAAGNDDGQYYGAGTINAANISSRAMTTLNRADSAPVWEGKTKKAIDAISTPAINMATAANLAALKARASRSSIEAGLLP